jgi:hypothetical protein
MDPWFSVPVFQQVWLFHISELLMSMQYLFQFPMMEKAWKIIRLDSQVSGKMIKGPGMMFLS